MVREADINAMRRFLAAMVVFAGFASPAWATSPDAEVGIVDLVNAARTEAGLETLSVDLGLIVTARAHSEDMASEARLFHSPKAELASIDVDWELIGENVGQGSDAYSIHDAFMASESHRANVLGEFDSVGVGAARSEDGTLYVTVIFMRRSPQAEALDHGPLLLISGLPEFAVSRLRTALAAFDTTTRELCSPTGAGPACID